MNSRLKNSIALVIIILVIVVVGYLFITMNMEEDNKTITYIENVDYTLNDLSNKIGELFSVEDTWVEENTLYIVYEEGTYEFILTDQYLLVESSNEKIEEVFKLVLLASQSYYYEDYMVLEETINKFLNKSIEVAGIWIENSSYGLCLDEAVDIYSPNDIYYEEDKIYLSQIDDFVFSSDVFEINNTYVYYDEESNLFSFGGNMSSSLESVTITVYIYDSEGTLLASEIKTIDNLNEGLEQFHINIDIENKPNYIVVSVEN